MKPSLAAFVVSLFAFAIALPAQGETPPTPVPLTGTYEILDTNGVPPVAGAKITVEVVPLVPLSGFYVFAVYIDRNDGNGPQLLSNECGILTPAITGHTYVNEAGGTGTVKPTGGGDLESEVTTGRNPGLKRKWRRQP